MRQLLIPLLLLAAIGVAEAKGPIPVEVVPRGDGFVLLRGGQSYAIRGAGVETPDRLESFAAHGGNSFRTWSTWNAQEMLDRAQELGLTVAMCLGVERERTGFDYDDEEAVSRQLEAMREEVMKYKDHPALLVWVIGNELNLFFENHRVYDAVNDISKMIHELDPNHPTTTTLAGFTPELARIVSERAPDLDFISIQAYADLINLPRYLKQARYKRPYMISEWGSIGHWEMPATRWEAPVEQTSTEKAGQFERMWDKVVSRGEPYNIGNYVFFWGQKQERTGTWYGLFTEAGEATEVVDVMYRIWNDEEPRNRAPRIQRLTLNNRRATDSPILQPGEHYMARIKARDPDGDALRYRWEVRLESQATEAGGDREVVPPLVINVVEDASKPEVDVHAPVRPGAYRLFVYVEDGNGSAGHANIPFYVRP